MGVCPACSDPARGEIGGGGGSPPHQGPGEECGPPKLSEINMSSSSSSTRGLGSLTYSFGCSGPFALQKSPHTSHLPKVKVKSSPLIEKLQVSAARLPVLTAPPTSPTPAGPCVPGELTLTTSQ